MLNYRVVDYLDTPEVLDASTISIPASSGSPLQVVAALNANCTAIYVRDGIQNRYIGVYTGQAGFEVLNCIIGITLDPIQPTFIAAGERVSLRSMDNAAIAADSIAIQFLGYA